jgi:O-antigen/teichoic acid export membrane protein
MNFFKNVLWSLTGTIGVRMIGLLTSILLARLLTPEIFGIVGMAQVVVGFIYVIQEAGLSSYLIQTKNISRRLISTSFILNVIFSLLLVIVVLLSTSFVADFYGQPDIKQLLYYSSFGILIASLGITQRGLLMREKQFKKITLVDLIAETTTSIFSVILALLGFPLLAVGLSMLFRPAVQSASLMIIVGLKPILGKPDLKVIKVMLPFSSNVLGTRVVNFVRNNIDYLLIGKLLGSTSLGLYTVAFQWSTVARFYFSQSIANVAFPEISRHQSNLDRVGSIYLNIIKKISFVTFPICIGLALAADNFVLTVYGDQWNKVVPVLQILMVAGLISSIGTVVGAVFKGIGRPDVELKVNFFSLLSFTVLILVGSKWGIIGVAVAVLINTIIFNNVMTLTLLKILKLKFINYLLAMKNSIFSTFFMGIILLLFNYSASYIGFFQNQLISFITDILLGVVTYIIGSYLFNKEMVLWVLEKLKLKKLLRKSN